VLGTENKSRTNTQVVEVIEQLDGWRQQFAAWKSKHVSNQESLDGYPFVENARAPFTPSRRALPMLNLALISSAGAYIDGTDPFDNTAPDGDFTFREIPSEIDPVDLRFSARGYDPVFVRQDVNVQLPLARLFEFEANGIIGQLNSAFWSFCGFIPDAALLVGVMLPKLVDRLKHYEVQAALLIPASRLCHQSVALAARAIEQAGIPTMMLSVERDIIEHVHPPRAGFYQGQFGSVAGKPNWPEHQRRVLDEALRWIETADQPGNNKLAVELESQVEAGRGER
jgi:D-proline reductase (dithiol) PrdB